MANLKIKNDIIHVKGSKLLYTIALVFFIFGGLIGCLYLIIEGFTFESNYFPLYIFGGIVFTPIFLYLFLWYLPGYRPGIIFFKINKDTMIANKRTIPIHEIKNIFMIRNGFNLMEEIIIETFQGKRIKIRTYNILSELSFQLIVDQYIYPYMKEETKFAWDKSISLDRLLNVGRYKREEHQIRP